MARHAQGRMAESDSELQGLIAEHGQHAAFQVAQVYAYRGNVEEGFRWLEKAYEQRDSGMCLTRVDPLLDSLHADARWEPFIRKMNLAEDQVSWLTKDLGPAER